MIFSVSQFLDVVNELLGVQDFGVLGEVVGAKPHPTGFYFSLKDPQGGGLMDCYLSPYAYRGLGFGVEDGMQVKVTGTPSIYKPKGRFSFRVETLELAGEGALKKAYEALKKKLAAEGLFDRKRELPKYISKIGLVTSKTGAVISDFRRNLLPLGLKIYHRDVRVEGERAPGQIISALQALNHSPLALDVIVLIRGGGSLEDLAAFNHENVVRSVFGSRVPTLVSIGHERDEPLAQLAADAAASTPTATAVLINASWEGLSKINQTAQRLQYAFETLFSSCNSDLQSHTYRLSTHLARLANRGRQLQDLLGHALDRVGAGIVQMRASVEAAERHLATANPERQLGLGYSIVTDASGAVVSDIAQLNPGQRVWTRLGKGSFNSEVKELESG